MSPLKLSVLVSTLLVLDPAHSDGTLKIGYFGDSTTLGVGISNYNQSLNQTCVYTMSNPGWTYLPNYPVHSIIKNGVPIAASVENLGYDGRTAQEQATTNLSEFDSILEGKDFGMVIVNFGINDARINRSKESYAADLRTIVEVARRKGIFVIVEKPNPIKECHSSSGDANATKPADLLEEYRSFIGSSSIPGPNIDFVDHGAWLSNYPITWYALLTDPLHPNSDGYFNKASRVATKISSGLPSWCGLSVTKNVVGPSKSYSLSLSHNLAPGLNAFWNGTKNGVVDMADSYAGAAGDPGQQTLGTYTNQTGWEGTYTRSVTIKNTSNSPVCTTPPITIQILPQTPSACTLSVEPAVVPPGGQYTFYATGPGSGTASTGRWYGTNAYGTDTMTSPGTQTFQNQPGWAGAYTRLLKFFDANQNLICTTNSVSLVLQ